jgi:hypothetical protein
MIIDVWAQPALAQRPGRLPIPEITRLFEKSGSADMMHADIGPEQLVALLDDAGVDGCCCRPGTDPAAG